MSYYWEKVMLLDMAFAVLEGRQFSLIGSHYQRERTRLGIVYMTKQIVAAYKEMTK